MKNKLVYLRLIISNYTAWNLWRKVKNGAKTKDFKRGCGYYIIVSVIGYNAIGEIEELEMKSGKIGLFELLEYKTFNDPWDMVEESWWHFVGYKGQKVIKDCSFSEFMELYVKE